MHGRSKHAPKHMSLANESKPDRKAVIMLTCCALQSACYSPTGIVILFILAQFQGEVQTNLTAGTRKNALSTGRDDLECPPLSGCGTQHPLRALCGTCVLLAAAPTTPPCFRRWRRSSSLHFGHFQRKNHLIFRVSGKSADFPETHFHGRGRNGKRQLQRRFLRKRGAAGDGLHWIAAG